MQENKITILINKPIETVFNFTVDPKNTHLWIPFISEEISSEYPPKIWTIYKNRRGEFNWNFYKVIELSQNKTFTLSDLNNNYHVRYSYRKIGFSQTELEYFEWVQEWALSELFSVDILETLKQIIESN